MSNELIRHSETYDLIAKVEWVERQLGLLTAIYADADLLKTRIAQVQAEQDEIEARIRRQEEIIREEEAEAQREVNKLWGHTLGKTPKRMQL